jgi:AbiU2
MGEPLGNQFAALWQEVAWLHMKWAAYVELFAEPERVEVLNQAAPGLFYIIREALWEQTLLHIARLTDRPDSGGGKVNLTIQSLPGLVEDTGIKALVKSALDKTKFCRDWRNRHIAHRDLNLLLNGSARPLETASGNQVYDALKAIQDVLSEVSLRYMDSSLVFPSNLGSVGNAISLLRLLHDGQRARAGKTPGEYPF